ncbi:MAG TPA: type II secretion system protein [Terriglobales bacterium]|nr:type II secretion system protein [Terriglobales bacterium]
MQPAVPNPSPNRRRRSCAGMTLIELIVATSILLVLTSMALPLARVTIQRQREHQLRAALDEMRGAIDRYKDAADRGLIQVQLDTQGYPPDLDTLVQGVPMGTEKIHFLRAIPKDPMTNSYDWGLRSVQDDPDSSNWGGQDVFNVYTTSNGTALDGTSYNKW